ncbi:substrate-binding domain-containing protein [Actinomadura alba]|nr:substrate-binding domain-containing protein [Actinomadura alba]
MPGGPGWGLPRTPGQETPGAADRPAQWDASDEPPYGARGFSGASDPANYGIEGFPEPPSLGGYAGGRGTGASEPGGYPSERGPGAPEPGGYGSGGYPPASERGGYGSGGFSGASDPGGYGPGMRDRSPAEGGRSHGPDGGPSGTGPLGAGGPYGVGDARSERAGGSSGYVDYGGYGTGGSGPFGGPRDELGSAQPSGRGGGGRGHGGRGRTGSGGGGSRKSRSLTALIGPLAGAVGLAILLGVGVYAFAEGGGCRENDTVTLNVAAAPDIAPAVNANAARFNDENRKVDGRCVQATVKSVEPAAMMTLLSGQGLSAAATQPPDVWIPDSSLWTSLVRASAKGREAVQVTRTSVAQSPVVIGMPQSLSATLRAQGVTATPSWASLLAAAGAAGSAVTKNQTIPSNLVRIELLDPARNAAGMASLMVTRMLLANDPNAQAAFTGVVRTVRESTAPDLKTQLAAFRRDSRGRYPMVLAPEQALWKHNQGRPAERAVALYPAEGTMALDYPFALTAKDPAKNKAAKLLEQALSTSRAKDEVRALGFRSSDGVAPASFGSKNGLNAKPPRMLPAPQPADVRSVMQAWAKLSLSVRMLALLDVSGSMAETVPGANVTRIQATAQVAQGGLSLLPDDTELGLWTFSTELVGARDWREDVTIGPLGQRIGSNTRRQTVLATLAGLRPKPTGDTGLYDSVLAAFRKMKTTYKPEMINSLLLLTDGKNDDQNGISLAQLRATLKKEFDPNRPVQVIMIGFGKGVDRNELDLIAKETRGSVHIANTPQEIQKIFLAAMSRRVCAPNC